MLDVVHQMSNDMDELHKIDNDGIAYNVIIRFYGGSRQQIIFIGSNNGSSKDTVSVNFRTSVN
ncbi:MAG: hypothetical protein Q8L88_01395 [Bacteroidota bacterium]|nr:hypothetical protein [Bacteroidota bacterium]